MYHYISTQYINSHIIAYNMLQVRRKTNGRFPMGF